MIVIILTGCSLTRRGGERYLGTSGAARSEIVTGTEDHNLTKENFFIRKAEIKVISEDGSDTFLGSLKFEQPDRFLLSLRSKTGIEAARIFLSADTVLINDRINRILYHGSPQALKRRYGISASLLPVVLGDFLMNKVSDPGTINCINGTQDIVSIIDGVRILYTIDCRLMKAILAVPDNSINQAVIELSYSDFFREAQSVIPGKIEVKDLQKKSSVEIKIAKFESPWIGNIEFIPGNNYEMQQLP
jgi:hypothetical protein